MLFLLLVSCRSVSQMSPEARAERGWISLFNGEDLDGWRSNEEAPGCFTVTDRGWLKVYGGRAHLFYAGADGDAVFDNFELVAKAMTMRGANSGIYFHTRYQDSGWPSAGYEAQVNTSHKDPKKTGGLYAIADVFDDAPSEDGKWFDYSIKVEGQRITVKVDGRVTADYVEPEEVLREPGFEGRLLTGGTFAIQAHDPKSLVYYKDLYVRRLD